MRRVSTRVLPEPAGAMIASGAALDVTASRWYGSRSSSSGSARGTGRRPYRTRCATTTPQDAIGTTEKAPSSLRRLSQLRSPRGLPSGADSPTCPRRRSRPCSPDTVSPAEPGRMHVRSARASAPVPHSGVPRVGSESDAAAYRSRRTIRPRHLDVKQNSEFPRTRRPARPGPVGSQSSSRSIHTPRTSCRAEPVWMVTWRSSSCAERAVASTSKPCSSATGLRVSFPRWMSLDEAQVTAEELRRAHAPAHRLRRRSTSRRAPASSRASTGCPARRSFDGSDNMSPALGLVHPRGRRDPRLVPARRLSRHGCSTTCSSTSSRTCSMPEPRSRVRRLGRPLPVAGTGPAVS